MEGRYLVQSDPDIADEDEDDETDIQFGDEDSSELEATLKSAEKNGRRGGGIFGRLSGRFGRLGGIFGRRRGNFRRRGGFFRRRGGLFGRRRGSSQAQFGYLQPVDSFGSDNVAPQAE